MTGTKPKQVPSPYLKDRTLFFEKDCTLRCCVSNESCSDGELVCFFFSVWPVMRPESRCCCNLDMVCVLSKVVLWDPFIYFMVGEIGARPDNSMAVD